MATIKIDSKWFLETAEDYVGIELTSFVWSARGGNPDYEIDMRLNTGCCIEYEDDNYIELCEFEKLEEQYKGVLQDFAILDDEYIECKRLNGLLEERVKELEEFMSEQHELLVGGVSSNWTNFFTKWFN